MTISKVSAIRKGSDVISKEGAAASEQFAKFRLAEMAARLQNLVAALSGSEVRAHSQALLPHVLAQADDLNIKRIEIADACQVSEATVSRWASGQNCPHRIIAHTAIVAIREIALVHAQKCEEEAAALSRAGA